MEVDYRKLWEIAKMERDRANADLAMRFAEAHTLNRALLEAQARSERYSQRIIELLEQSLDLRKQIESLGAEPCR